MTLKYLDEAGFGNVIYSWISCRNAILGASWKRLDIFLVTVIWGRQVLHHRKSGWWPLAAIFLFLSMSWGRVVSLCWWLRCPEPRSHGLWELMWQLCGLNRLLSKWRSELRIEKAEDHASACHFLHILTAQHITSNSYSGASVTTVTTAQKSAVKNPEICKSLKITVNSPWAEVLLKSQIGAVL